MNISRSFQLGVALAYVAFMSGAFFNQTQAQSCSIATGSQVSVAVTGNYPCYIDVEVTYTGATGSPFTCSGISPFDMAIPAGATITGFTVNGVTVPAIATCLQNPNFDPACDGGICLVTEDFLLNWDSSSSLVYEVHVN